MNVDKLIDTQLDYIATIYRDIETRIIMQIAEMIERNGKITGTGEYNLKRLQQLTGLDRQVIEEISRISGKPMQEVVNSIRAIGINSIDFETYRTAYDRGILLKNIDVLNLNPMLKALTDEASGIIKSVETKALEHSFKAYKSAIDIANIEVTLGTKTPTVAIKDAVKTIASKGITSATYLRQGKEVEMSLEPTVNRIVRTEFIKASNKVSHEVGVELDVEDWYVTQHIGARDKGLGYENHEKWQGQVYSTKELETVCGYETGDMLGLGGYNCRHRHYGYIKGISIPIPEKIDTDLNARVYNLTQTQRRYEREIRNAKRVKEAMTRIDNEDAVAEVDRQQKIIRARQKSLRSLINKNNDVLRRDYSREQIYS